MSVDYRKGASPDALADVASGSVACVLTDPPYGIETQNTIYGRRREGRATSIANDTDLGALEACAPEIKRWLAPDGVALVFCAPPLRRTVEGILLDVGLDPIYPLPWDKGAPGISYRVRFAFEDVVLAVHPGYDPWDVREPIVVPVRFPRLQVTEHPNEKPVGLLRLYLAWACPTGGLVADPFAGIASSAVAALAQGCSWVGAECDPRWWPVAERRIADALNRPHADITQPSLFGQGEAA